MSTARVVCVCVCMRATGGKNTTKEHPFFSSVRLGRGPHAEGAAAGETTLRSAEIQVRKRREGEEE